MKRLLVLLVLCILAAVPLAAQTPQFVPVADFELIVESFTASGSGQCRSVPQGIGYWTLRWIEDGEIVAGTVKLQGSNNACVTVTDIIAAQTITDSGKVENTEGNYRYIQLVVASFTGTGTLRPSVFGYKSLTTGLTSGTVTANLSTTDNAVLDDIADGITVQIQSGGTAVPLITDPCDGQDKTSVPFSTSTATTTELANASASNKMYICGFIVWPVSAAQTLALVEDDTDTCASPTAGIIGGVSAATGAQIPAGGGFVSTNGGATVAKTAATNRYVCIITSTTAVTPGVLTYVLAP